MHTLVGAGKADGAMDASNLLKPALARGELHCIGATTLDEYRKHVEKDAALARRFQPIFVSEPTVEDTISILRGLKDKYEQHHGVRITDSALVAATTLSNRYITDRFLPDKAIDLMDEASARLKMQVDSKPEELDLMDREIIRLKIEQEALKKETDIGSKSRLQALEKELADLEDKSAALTARWSAEKNKLSDAQKLKSELDALRIELANAQRRGEFQRAGELAYGKIPELEKRLESIEPNENPGERREEAVTANHIAQVVSRWTGVPVDKMLEGEKDKLLKMEDQLGRRVVGQAEAVRAVATAVRRSRAGLQDPNRPMGSFMFLGPTGVGKTELTKALAEYLFNDETAMVRLDMSEYMEKHSVSRLIGAPPGYVGYDEGGALTEAVRRRADQVVLFVAIEKDHPDGFDGTRLYHRWQKREMARTVENQSAGLQKLREERKTPLALDAAGRDWLAPRGWDPAYGARPLKRVIQRNLQDPLAEMILEGSVVDGDRVVISSQGNVLTFNGKAPKTAEIATFEAPVPKRKLN